MKGVGWTSTELDRLELLRSHGLSWGQIAGKMPGRTAAACSVAHHSIKTRRLCAEARDKAREIAQREQIARREAWFAEAAKKPAPPSLAEVNRRSRLASQTAPRAREIQGSGMAVSTSLLLIDAELRARIEILGPTGGMLGDPMPGRSALDRRRLGIPDPAPSMQGQRPIPKITLAGAE
jgi:hypothetical protein